LLQLRPRFPAGQQISQWGGSDRRQRRCIDFGQFAGDGLQGTTFRGLFAGVAMPTCGTRRRRLMDRQTLGTLLRRRCGLLLRTPIQRPHPIEVWHAVVERAASVVEHDQM
jgi:hypothetical protein